MNKNILKILGTCLIVAIIAYVVDFEKLLASFSNWHFEYLHYLIPLTILNIFFEGYRWYVLFDPLNRKNLLFLICLPWESAFAGMFLPGTLGSDLYRVALIRQNHSSLFDAISNVLIIRILGVVALVPFSVVALIFKPSLSENPVIEIPMLAFLLGSVVFILVMFLNVGTSMLLKVAHFCPSSISKMIQAMLFYQKRKKELFFSLVVAVLCQITTVFLAFFCAKSAIQDLSLIDFFAIFPIASILCLLPVGINSFGTQEAAYMFLFSQVGILKEQALLASIIWNGFKTILMLSGGVVLAIRMLTKWPSNSNRGKV